MFDLIFDMQYKNEIGIVNPHNPKPIIFVSSTIDNLPNERTTAYNTIEKMAFYPSMSDYTFEAVNSNSIKACIDKVKECDVFILMLGPTYGWELPNGISITELEYDTAYKENKPIFVFNLKYNKEEKQKIFEKKIGSLYEYKTVKDVYELENEIKKSLLKYFDKLRKDKKTKTEKICSNLVEMFFPNDLYIGKLIINRDEIIKNSYSTDKKLKWDTSTREVVFSALKQKGLTVGSDWVTHENNIITFYDLYDPKNYMRSIIDPGTIEMISSKQFYDISIPYERVFKDLLYKCFARKAFNLKIYWNYKIRTFYFVPFKDEDNKREETWHSKKMATRTVFEKKYKKTNPDELSYCKHLSFKVRFHNFNDKWYMEVTPDWYISWKDYKLSQFSDQRVTYLKKKERNNQVYNHVKFIVSMLRHNIENDLFTSYKDYKLIKIGQLLSIDSYPIVEDDLWFNKESKEEKERLRSKQNLVDLFV